MDSSAPIVLLVLLVNVRTSHPSTTGGSHANGCSDQRLRERLSKEMHYIGCFESACFRNETSFNISTLGDCTGVCKNESHLSAALEGGGTCYCGSFVCSLNEKICDNKCGIPCSGNKADLRFICGGKGFLQVYGKDETKTGKEGRTGSESWLFLTVAIVGVLTTAVVFICLGLAWTKRRMRSQDRREQRDETHQTSRRRRPQLLRRSLSDYRNVNRSHANTDNSTPPITAQLSSNNTYDFLRDGNRMNAGKSKPTAPRSTSKVPNCAQSSHNPGHNHRKCNDRVADNGDVCSGICCSASKNGVECCCHNGGRHFGGRPSDETASSTASYFSLEPNSPKIGIAARFKMVDAVKPRQRGKMGAKQLGCSPNNVAEDDSYAYAMCDDQDLDNVDYHYYSKANTVIQEEVYEMVADFKSQHKNHEY